MRISIKHLFIFSYSLVIIAGVMQYHTLSLIPSIAIYLMYALIWGVYALKVSDFKIPNYKKNAPVQIIYLLIIYYSIFTFVNIGDLDKFDTLNNYFRTIIMFLIIVITWFWVKKMDLFESFIRNSFWIITLILLWNFMSCIQEIDIVRTINFFWHAEDQLSRYRVLFGFKYNNIAAEYAISAIILSLVYIDNNYNNLGILSYKKKQLLSKRSVILFADIIMVIIIIANNSRGTTLTLILLFLIYFWMKIIRKHSVKKVIKYLVLFFMIIVVFLFYYVTKNGLTILSLFEGTTRSHLIDNVEIVIKNNLWLTGLGQISGAYFAERHYLYGMRLNYMEMYYVGVFVKSGIIGSIWMIYIILKLIKSIYSISIKDASRFTEFIFIVFGYMLVISLFEEYLFSYTYITSILFTTIVLIFIDMKNKKQDEYSNE